MPTRMSISLKMSSLVFSLSLAGWWAISGRFMIFTAYSWPVALSVASFTTANPAKSGRSVSQQNPPGLTRAHDVYDLCIRVLCAVQPEDCRPTSCSQGFAYFVDVFDFCVGAQLPSAQGQASKSELHLGLRATRGATVLDGRQCRHCSLGGSAYFPSLKLTSVARPLPPSISQEKLPCCCFVVL